MRKILFTGSTGQLGRSLELALSDARIPSVGFSRENLDLCDQLSVERAILDLTPEIVINCAAWTAVDDAEEHEESATRINRDAVGHLAKSCHQVGARLIHISTDYVFDGQADSPYSVTAATSPVSAYGRSKLAGEDLARDILGHNLTVVRTAWLYSEYGKNFAKTIGRKALNGEPVRVVADQIGQPTSTHALSRLIIQLIESGSFPPMVHGTCGGSASWFDFACMIYDVAGAPRSLVSAVSSDEYPTRARRPSFSVLAHDWKGSELIPIPDWQEIAQRDLPRVIDVLKREG